MLTAQPRCSICARVNGKEKIPLSLHHVVKAYKKVTVKLYAFLLNLCIRWEWSSSSLCRIAVEERIWLGLDRLQRLSGCGDEEMNPYYLDRVCPSHSQIGSKVVCLLDLYRYLFLTFFCTSGISLMAVPSSRLSFECVPVCRPLLFRFARKSRLLYNLILFLIKLLYFLGLLVYIFLIFV